MVKQLCRVHSYYYTGNECPFCMQERSQKMSLRWEEKNVLVPKKRFENSSKQESMGDMLEKLKEKYNSH